MYCSLHLFFKFWFEGEQFVNFLVTKVLYKVWQYQQMEAFLYHVEVIARKTNFDSWSWFLIFSDSWLTWNLNTCTIFKYHLNFLTVIFCSFFSVRLWNVPDANLAYSDNLSDNSAKVCLFNIILIFLQKQRFLPLFILFLNPNLYPFYFLPFFYQEFHCYHSKISTTCIVQPVAVHVWKNAFR